jgi:hypothetical protein
MKSIKNLNIVYKIDPQFTADQWQLYTASKDCTEASVELNEILRSRVNGGLNREEVTQCMHRAMKKLSDYGAYDSEPTWFLENVLDVIYGRDE